MKKIILTILITLFAFSAAYAGDDDSFKSISILPGCFVPGDVNYNDVYGKEREFAFTLAFEKEISQTFAIGTSLMYFDDTGKGVSPSFLKSSVKTELTLLKGELSAIYKMKSHDDQIIVPQVKAGLSVTYLNEHLKDHGRTEDAYFGYHAGFALLLLMDRLDPDNARNMRMSYGIEDTYFYVGMDYSDTDIIDANKLSLGGIEYNAGLMFRY